MNNQILIDLILEVKKELSDMKTDVADIRAETIKNTASLAEHMFRSDVSESRLEVQEDKLDHFITSMEPVKEHVQTVHTVTRVGVNILKILGLLASIGGVILGFLRLH